MNQEISNYYVISESRQYHSLKIWSHLVYNKFTNIRQHNNYLLNHIGYMFRPVNRSSSGLQQNTSKILLENWDPNILFSYKQLYNF